MFDGLKRKPEELIANLHEANKNINNLDGEEMKEFLKLIKKNGLGEKMIRFLSSHFFFEEIMFLPIAKIVIDVMSVPIQISPSSMLEEVVFDWLERIYHPNPAYFEKVQ